MENKDSKEPKEPSHVSSHHHHHHSKEPKKDTYVVHVCIITFPAIGYDFAFIYIFVRIESLANFRLRGAYESSNALQSFWRI